MRVNNGIVIGDIVVSGSTTIGGILQGSAVVVAGGHLTLAGIITMNLRIEPGAVAEVRGIVQGDVTNEGGRLSITGIVSGTVLPQTGETRFSPGAVIGHWA